MHALQIAANGFRPERHRAIDQRADPDGTAALEVAAEIGRDFDRSRDVSALEPIVELGIGAERRLLREIARASEFFQIGAAFRTLIVVEHRKRQIVDVCRDAEAEYQHQKRGTKQTEAEPDRIAQQFQRLADRIGEQAPQAEQGAIARGVAVSADAASRALSNSSDLGRPRSVCRLEIADEGVFERGGASGRDQLTRRAGRQHAAGIHQRDPVAAFGLVHEMGRDENRHALVAREIDQCFPEAVTRQRDRRPRSARPG